MIDVRIVILGVVNFSLFKLEIPKKYLKEVEQAVLGEVYYNDTEFKFKEDYPIKRY